MRYENKRVGNSNDWRLVYLIDGSAFLMDIYGTWDEEGNQKFKTKVILGTHKPFWCLRQDFDV